VAQPKKRLGEEFSEVVFVLVDLWRDLSLETLPKWFDRVQRRRIRRDEDELDAEFVGPFLRELRVMGSIVASCPLWPNSSVAVM
jgi:hypothetical protein